MIGTQALGKRLIKIKKCDLNLLRDNLVIKDITAIKDDKVMRLCN